MSADDGKNQDAAKAAASTKAEAAESRVAGMGADSVGAPASTGAAAATSVAASSGSAAPERGSEPAGKPGRIARTGKTSDLGMIRRLWPYARPVRVLMSAAAVLMLVEELLPFAGPHLLRRVVDGLAEGQRFTHQTGAILLLFAAILGGAVAGFLRTVAITAVGSRVIHEFRLKLFSHLQSLGMAFFHRNPVGTLMTRLTNDVDSLHTLLSEVLLELAGSIVMIAFGAAYMLAVDWRLALCCLAFLPPMLWVTHIFRVNVRDSNREIRRELALLNGSLQENIAGIGLVRLFGREESRAREFETHNRAYRDAFFRNISYYAYYFPALNILTEIAVALLFFVGTSLFYQGETTIGTLSAFSWTMGLFFRPLRELSDRLTNLQQSLAAGERVFALMDEKTDLPSGSAGFAAPTRGHVVFRGVTFGYDPARPVVRAIDIEIAPGRTTALVGATGSGKSTLASLLCRFYDPQEGAVSLDGTDLRDLEPGLRGRSLGIVLQEPYLFPGSILDNIVLGREVDRARAWELCRMVQLAPWIEALSQGIDTPVGERGARLSTGQRQLLSFARALYHDPAVLVFDEATSAIDATTEAALQTVSREALRGRTALVIAHRLATVREADEILVLHHGEVRERGTHAELLRHAGIYARLWEMQSRSAEAAGSERAA